MVRILSEWRKAIASATIVIGSGEANASERNVNISKENDTAMI